MRAENGNLLDCRRSNLQSVSCSDIAILNRRTTKEKLIGVSHAVPPRWMKSTKHYHAHIRADGVKVFLGSFKTREEAACCWDAAARRLYGWREATTNVKLGLITAKVTRTKICRLAARVGKHKIEDRQNKLAMAQVIAFRDNPTRENFLALARHPMRQPPVFVKSFASGAEVLVEPQVPVVAQPSTDTATADAKRAKEKSERRVRRAARRTRKAAKQEVSRGARVTSTICFDTRQGPNERVPSMFRLKMFMLLLGKMLELTMFQTC